MGTLTLLNPPHAEVDTHEGDVKALQAKVRDWRESGIGFRINFVRQRRTGQMLASDADLHDLFEAHELTPAEEPDAAPVLLPHDEAANTGLPLPPPSLDRHTRCWRAQ